MLDYDLPSWERRYSHCKVNMFEDDFTFSRGGISWFWRGITIAIIIKFSLWMDEFNLGVNTHTKWLIAALAD